MVLAVLLAAASAAGAQTTTTVPSPPTPALVPAHPGPQGYFTFTLSPGQSITSSVRVSNPGPGPATFDLYPADGLTSDATGVVYTERGAPVTATGKWIQLTAASVTLGPGQNQTVPFTVVAPAGPFAGNHVGAIVAENPATSSEQSGTGGGAGLSLNVGTRVIVAVVVTVPGTATADLQLGQPAIVAENGSQQLVTLPMTSPGGLLFKPKVDVTVASCSGVAEAKLDRQLDTFVPHTSIVYQWSLAPQILPAGCYRITATALFGTTELSTVTSQVTVSSSVASVNPAGPGPAPGHGSVPSVTKPTNSSSLLLGVLGGAAGVLLLIGIGLFIFFLLRRRRRKDEGGPASGLADG